jgi:hypothetical protein
MADLADFSPRPWQEAFMESPERFTCLPLRAGGRGGRTAATIARIYAEAADQHEAELAIKDLRERGVACLKDGKRYVPSAPRLATVVFDEEPAGGSSVASR